MMPTARAIMASDRIMVAGAGESAPGRFAVARLLRQLPENAMAPVFTRAVLVAVLCGYVTRAYFTIPIGAGGIASPQLAALYLLALLALQVFYFSNPNIQPRPPVSYLLLAVQACLVFVPLLQFGHAWFGQPGFLAGTVLLILPRKLGLPLFPLIAATMATIQWYFHHLPVNVAFSGVATIDNGLVVFGLTRLARLVSDLHRARTELAEMAVAQERLRFARDLHDLLGYSLSAITLKSELTYRLLLKNPEKAQEELTEMLDISRRALADVRSVARGYRELSLDHEAESAQSVLVAADVAVRMDLKYGELPAQVRTLLATVLREGVTNVLRHSKAEHCDIIVWEDGDQVLMEIVNDGVTGAPAERDPHSGSGISNLQSRLRAVGGTLTARVEPDDRFRLHACVPRSVSARQGTAGT
jgi:two-component system sensor histidine kinase DesK